MLQHVGSQDYVVGLVAVKFFEQGMYALNVRVPRPCTIDKRFGALQHCEMARGFREGRGDEAVSIAELEHPGLAQNLPEQPLDEIFLAQVFNMDVRNRLVRMVFGSNPVELLHCAHDECSQSFASFSPCT